MTSNEISFVFLLTYVVNVLFPCPCGSVAVFTDVIEEGNVTTDGGDGNLAGGSDLWRLIKGMQRLHNTASISRLDARRGSPVSPLDDLDLSPPMAPKCNVSTEITGMHHLHYGDKSEHNQAVLFKQVNQSPSASNMRISQTQLTWNIDLYRGYSSSCANRYFVSCADKYVEEYCFVTSNDSGNA